MNKVLYRFWYSATFMTWGSILTRSLSLLLVIPLVIKKFPVEDIALWFLFTTILGLQILVDMGFTPTFTRVIAYAMGGAEEDQIASPKKPGSGKPNLDTLAKICSTMNYIYARLSFGWFFVLLIIGTVFVIRPISISSDITSSWIAWGVILTVSLVSLWGNYYNSFLQGINQVALVKRWEMFSSIGAITTSFLVLIFNGDVLALIIANQIWVLFRIVRNKFLAEGQLNSFLKQSIGKIKHEIIFTAVWPSTWKSGLGILMSYGVIQFSGIFYAQVGKPADVAMYLFALRLIQTISQFSQGPFYSKLPFFAKLYALKDFPSLIKYAKRGMKLSFWSFIIPFILAGIFGEFLISLIKGNISFPPILLWNLLGLGYFLERFGAMHIQLYSTTNNIIWHIANSVTGILFILISIVLYSFIGIYSFPVAIIFSYLGFYTWYSARYSYKSIGMTFWDFEKNTSLIPVNILLIYFITNLLFTLH